MESPEYFASLVTIIAPLLVLTGLAMVVARQWILSLLLCGVGILAYVASPAGISIRNFASELAMPYSLIFIAVGIAGLFATFALILGHDRCCRKE